MKVGVTTAPVGYLGEWMSGQYLLETQYKKVHKSRTTYINLATKVTFIHKDFLSDYDRFYLTGICFSF